MKWSEYQPNLVVGSGNGKVHRTGRRVRVKRTKGQGAAFAANYLARLDGVGVRPGIRLEVGIVRRHVGMFGGAE